MIVLLPDLAPGASERLIPLNVLHRTGVLLPNETVHHTLALNGERHLHAVLVERASLLIASIDRADLELWLMASVTRALRGPVQKVEELLPRGIYWLEVRAPVDRRSPGGRYAISLRCVLSRAPAS
jgi:hypothetical protein